MKKQKNRSRTILEIGSGSVPWPVTSYVYQYQRFGFDARSALQVEVTTLTEADRYICFDKYEANHDHAKLEFQELTRLGQHISAQLEFVTGDGVQLPYGTGHADVVVLSNILSAPITGRLYMGSARRDVHDPAICATEEDKVAMVQEAIRVLKPVGSLIIANDLTPCYAKPSMKHLAALCEEGRIHLFREFGSYVETDDWIVWHQEYRIGPRPTDQSVQQIPWSEPQKKAIRAWVADWHAQAAFMDFY